MPQQHSTSPTETQLVSNIFNNDQIPPDISIRRIVVTVPAILSNSAAALKEVRDAIKAIPAPILDGLAQRGYQLKVVEKVTDQWPSLVGKRPRGWPSGTRYDDLAGVYWDGVAAVAVAGTAGGTGIANVALHETGHAIDELCGVISKTTWFRQSWDDAIVDGTIDLWETHSGISSDYLSQPNGVGQEEWFAELIAQAWGGVDRRDIIESIWPGLLARMSDAIKGELHV